MMCVSCVCVFVCRRDRAAGDSASRGPTSRTIESASSRRAPSAGGIRPPAESPSSAPLSTSPEVAVVMADPRVVAAEEALTAAACALAAANAELAAATAARDDNAAEARRQAEARRVAASRRGAGEAIPPTSPHTRG